MVDPLILGSGSLVPAVVDSFDGPLTVGTPDDRLASTLQGPDVDVRALDPTDVAALTEVGAGVVFVIEDTNRSGLAAAEAVRQALPDAHLVAYTAEEDTDGSIAEVADRVVEPDSALGSRVLDCVRRPGLPALWGVLRDIDHLSIVAHDNPDPDAIASGVALARLAHAAGCETDVCYYGAISHHENRAFVNVLGLDLRNLAPAADLSAFDGVALVDHARPGVNDGLPPDTPVDIVIDHHPPRGPVEAEFVDLRRDVGATSTLLVEYLERYGAGDGRGEPTGHLLEPDVATALLFGIHVDTDEFTRGVCEQDLEAAATLVGVADQDALERIESPSIDRETFGVLASAIERRHVEGNTLLTCVGTVSNRSALPQAADRLLGLDEVGTTVVYGIAGETVHISARSSDDTLDLGELVRQAFGARGDAGGHANMAGAQLDLETFREPEDGESVVGVVELEIRRAFVEVLERRSPRPAVSELFDQYRAGEQTGGDDGERSPEDGN